jgi:hypothetical protein
MYCPHCGTRNAESDARFCRSCGEDLRLVSQAVMKRMSWPMYVATRIDEFMASRQQKEPFDTGILFLGYGALSAVAGIMSIYRRGFDAFSAILFMSSFLALWIGTRNLWIYLRKRSDEYHPTYDKSSNPAEHTVLKLGVGEQVNQAAGGIAPAESLPAAPPSVTEPTTKTLQAPIDNRLGGSPATTRGNVTNF